MIYGDWESGYQQVPVLLNAMKAVNPDMHYEYNPKPNAWIDGRQIFFCAFWCFPQSVDVFRHCRLVFSIDSTFLLGKYQGTLLIAISVDANNKLVPLHFLWLRKRTKIVGVVFATGPDTCGWPRTGSWCNVRSAPGNTQRGP
jgi:hypothetical protein